MLLKHRYPIHKVSHNLAFPRSDENMQLHSCSSSSFSFILCAFHIIHPHPITALSLVSLFTSLHKSTTLPFPSYAGATDTPRTLCQSPQGPAQMTSFLSFPHEEKIKSCVASVNVHCSNGSLRNICLTTHKDGCYCCLLSLGYTQRIQT